MNTDELDRLLIAYQAAQDTFSQAAADYETLQAELKAAGKARAEAMSAAQDAGRALLDYVAQRPVVA